MRHSIINIFLLLDLIMLAFGIVVLVKGELKLTAERIVRGVWARVIGGLLVAALPVGLLFRLVVMLALRGGGQAPGSMSIAKFLFASLGAEIAIAVFCVVFAIIGSGQTPPPPRPRSPYMR